MKITKSLVRKIMLKCWKRAKRLRKHLNALDQLSLSRAFEHRFNNIKIFIKVPTRKRAWGRICGYRYKKDENGDFPCHLTINPKAPFDLQKLEDTVAHELAHFLDLYSAREVCHDFQFLHNYLLFSNKKRTRMDLENFFGGYVMKTPETFKSYSRILKEK